MKKLILLLSLGLASCSNPSSNGHEASGSLKSKNEIAIKVKNSGEGPFGIDAGTKIDLLSVQGDRDAETGVSMLSSVPKSSSQFPNVAVISYPSTGVCKIRSGSNDFKSDSYLVNSVPFIDEIAAALKTKYGEAALEDGCSGYSCDSQFKLQAIQDGSRWYRYQWNSTEKQPLPNNLNEIYLYIAHTEFNNSHVRLDYQFDNVKACRAAAKNAKSISL